MLPAEGFRQLERRAYEALKNPSSAPTGSCLREPEVALLMWRYPAFAPYACWALIEEIVPGNVWTVRWVTWDRPQDLRRATDPLLQPAFMIEKEPPPTLDVLDVRVSDDFAVEVMTAARALPFPAIQREPQLGLDGPDNGFATVQYGAGSKPQSPANSRLEADRKRIKTGGRRRP